MKGKAKGARDGRLAGELRKLQLLRMMWDLKDDFRLFDFY